MIPLRNVTLRHLLLLALLTVAVFGTTLGFGFVWDDTIFVPDGQVYRSFDLAAMFFSLRANGLEYLPVRDVSYAIDCALWGKQAAGFHASNLLIYLLNVVAVYFLVRQLAALFSPEPEQTEQQGRLALVAALLFALHPLHSEVVSFITCRNTLLSGLFFFLACLAWLQLLQTSGTRHTAAYAATLLAFVLSLFSKANGIVLPLVLLCLTLLVKQRGDRRRLLPLLPLFAGAGGAFFLFTAIARRTDVFLREPLGLNFGGKLLRAPQIPLFYLEKLLLPRHLSADYGIDHFAVTFASSRFAVGLLLLLLLAGAAWQLRKKTALASFAIAWFLITLLPVLNLLPTLPVVADRYAFLPSFGFCLLAAILLVRVPRSLLRAGLVVLVALLGLLSWRQNRTWRDDKTLWQHTLEVSPRSANAAAELGRIYFFSEKNIPLAAEMYRRASEADPADPAFDIFQGHLAMMQHDYGAAIRAFGRATVRSNDNIEAVLNLGRAYEAAGRKDEAMMQYTRAVDLPELDPRSTMRARAAGYLQRLEGK